MKSTALLAFAAATLAACSTPVTTLKHPKTAEQVSCGGGMAGSIAGGMVGYSIQQDNDADCIKAYQKKGFKIQQTKTSSME